MSRDDEIDKAFEELISQVDFDDLDDDEEPETPAADDRQSLSDRFRERGWSESLETEATWEDEGHFVPPEPPPPPPVAPRRRLAWGGLFGSPLVMLAAVVLGFGLPTWSIVLLVLAFVGGFVYLVGTMSREPHDPWSGDDGAVV